MSDDNVRPLPGVVTLDLDSAEREDAPPKFKAVVGGREIVFEDPEELEWQDLLELESPNDFLRFAISEEDRSHIYSLKLPGWKFGKLMEAYQRHYGIDEKLNKIRRENQRRGL